MSWVFILIVLWLKDGTPEPHVATLAAGVTCDETLADDVADKLISDSDHSDDFTGEYDAWCEGPAKPQENPRKGST